MDQPVALGCTSRLWIANVHTITYEVSSVAYVVTATAEWRNTVAASVY
jgi:hypothetical protein